MLIKTGTVVTAVAAGMLALSPMAFAHDSDHHWGHHDGGHWGHHDGDDDGDSDSDASPATCQQANSAADNHVSGGGLLGGGLLNVSDINAQVPVQACNNSIIEGVLGILSSNQSNSDDHGN